MGKIVKSLLFLNIRKKVILKIDRQMGKFFRKIVEFKASFYIEYVYGLSIKKTFVNIHIDG